MTKKILFNDKYSLTQEVRYGNKTMTRRSFKVPKSCHGKEVYSFNVLTNSVGTQCVDLVDEDGRILGSWKPHYEVGDIVAIAQSYKTVYSEIEDKDAAEKFRKEYENTAGWNNKMFVKADLLPHHIKITDIKIERLQDISEEDALREGIEEFCFDYFLPNDYSKPFLMPRDAFAVLIDKVGKKGDWESNPWVAAYSFELVD